MNDLFLIGLCVILPIVVVWLNNRKEQNEIKLKTQVMLKAIEAGMPIDEELLKPQRTVKTIKERLFGKLTAACVLSAIGLVSLLGIAVLAYQGGADTMVLGTVIIFGIVVLAIGIGLFVAYFIGRKMLAKEIEAELQSLDKKEE